MGHELQETSNMPYVVTALDLPRLWADLSSPDIERQCEAISKLAPIYRENSFMRAKVYWAAKSHDEKLRAAGIEALGDLWDKKAIDVLLSCVRRDIPHIRQKALWSLTKMWWGESEKALPPLVKMLLKLDAPLRLEAVKVIQRLLVFYGFSLDRKANMDSQHPLVNKVKPELEKLGVRLRILPDFNELVRRIPSELVIAILQGDSMDDRQFAFVSLVRAQDKRFVEIALQMADDADPQKRVDAMTMLGGLKEVRAIPLLIEHLTDMDEYPVEPDEEPEKVLEVAARALENIGTPEALIALAEWQEKSENA